MDSLMITFEGDQISTTESEPEASCLPLQKLCRNGVCVFHWTLCPEELWTLAMERFLLGGACGVTVGCALYLAYYISSKQGTFSRPQRPVAARTDPALRAVITGPPTYEEVVTTSLGSPLDQLSSASEEEPATPPPTYISVCPDFPSQRQGNAATGSPAVCTI